jgi:hypothetical protein
VKKDPVTESQELFTGNLKSKLNFTPDIEFPINDNKSKPDTKNILKKSTTWKERSGRPRLVT